MIFTIFLLVFCFLVYLFCLFLLTREDFLLIRKGISTEQIFNYVFLIAFVALFSSRLSYVAFNFDKSFLNPLVFLLFTHFPGLSLAGAVIGGGLFSCLLFKNKNVPLAHGLDLLAISFLCSLTLGSFINLLTMIKTGFPAVLIFPFLSLVIFVFMSIIYHKSRAIKDGGITCLSLILFSALSFIGVHIFKKPFLIKGEDFLFLGIIMVSIFIFLIQQKILKLPQRNNKFNL
ncbi:MAG: prolipoprotein diacylglyceryl transferase [bacterium]|nr:prolipoprotein diacylglyceryl transferase [bacterium]